MEKIFENEHKTVELWKDDILKVISLKFLGEVEPTDYEEAFIRLFDAIKRSNFQRMIYDLSEIESTHAIARARYVNEYVPKITEHTGNGVKIAIVGSPNGFINMSSQMIQDAVANALPQTEMKRFENQQEALDWLRV